MDQAFSNTLRDVGLSHEEARVYEAVLELGQSVVTPVAALAKVNRTTCYNILESLAQRKLISKSRYRGKLSYGVDDPRQLLQNLEEQKKQIEITIERAKLFQSELAKRYVQKRTKPIIKYVQGIEGIKELYEDSLHCQNKEEGLRVYASLRDLTEELGDYADRYYAERTRRGIPGRGIIPDTEYGKQCKREAGKYLRQVRLIPATKFDFSPEIYLYDNKFSVMSFKEKFGFLLESKEIVDALKVAWELAWEKAGEYDKEIEV